MMEIGEACLSPGTLRTADKPLSQTKRRHNTCFFLPTFRKESTLLGLVFGVCKAVKYCLHAT